MMSNLLIGPLIHLAIHFMFDTFYSRLSNIIDRHIPIKKLSAKEIKQLSKPWITPGITVEGQ